MPHGQNGQMRGGGGGHRLVSGNPGYGLQERHKTQGVEEELDRLDKVVQDLTVHIAGRSDATNTSNEETMMGAIWGR